MKKYFFVLLAAIFFLAGCETLNKIPTNTSGGIFSLNGTWRLDVTNDNNALVGTTVSVFPGIVDGTITTLSNNTYCLRERDVLWRSLKALSAGGFTFENLVNSCNNATVYRAAMITNIKNDEIRINGQKDVGGELIQTWKRVN